MSNNSLSETDFLLIAKQAGLTPDEIKMDPEHGVLVTISGAHKLAKNAPGKELGERFSRWVDDIVVPRLSSGRK